MASFAEADKVIHCIEDEWFYPILVPLGFTPSTQTAMGLVRSYTLKHKDGRWLKCSIGVNANSWSASDGTTGYESKLKLWAAENYNQNSIGCFSYKQL